MVKDNLSFLMEKIMKENGRMGKNMGKEHSPGRMGTSMLEIGMLEKSMDKGRISGQMETGI